MINTSVKKPYTTSVYSRKMGITSFGESIGLSTEMILALSKAEKKLTYTYKHEFREYQQTIFLADFSNDCHLQDKVACVVYILPPDLPEPEQNNDSVWNTYLAYYLTSTVKEAIK